MVSLPIVMYSACIAKPLFLIRKNTKEHLLFYTLPLCVILLLFPPGNAVFTLGKINLIHIGSISFGINSSPSFSRSKTVYSYTRYCSLLCCSGLFYCHFQCCTETSLSLPNSYKDTPSKLPMWSTTT